MNFAEDQINSAAHAAATNPITESAALEAEAIRVCERKVTELQMAHPDWSDLYEDTVPDSALREEVVELLHSAPNDFAKGLMYGKYLMRQELAAVTGRFFE